MDAHCMVLVCFCGCAIFKNKKLEKIRIHMKGPLAHFQIISVNVYCNLIKYYIDFMLYREQVVES